MKIVIGLGNPGERYENSRHNIGFAALDNHANNNGEVFTEKSQFQSLVSESHQHGEKIVLVKPLTFMNRSGEAVGKVLRYYQVSLEDVLVVHDDTALPFNTIRLRMDGGSGGHNGIASIIDTCGNEFWRLRVGVGAPPQGYDMSNYVLGQLEKDQISNLPLLFEEVDSIINGFIKGVAEPKTIEIENKSL